MCAYPKTYAAAAAAAAPVCVFFLVCHLCVSVCLCVREPGCVYRKVYGHESLCTLVALELRQEHTENSQICSS